MQQGPLLSLSLSFDSYSSTNLAEIAARVVEECRSETGLALEEDEIYGSDEENLGENFGEILKFDGKEEKKLGEAKNYEDDRDDDEEFEFSFVKLEIEDSPISADEIFFNGQIRPIFPVFGEDFEMKTQNLMFSKPPAPSKPSTVRVSLKKLLNEEREAPSSCSSSEADELDGVPPGTYCVWRPKKAVESEEQSPERCKKSNSTGSSKRWKLRELMRRSSSDGKENLVFLTPLRKDDKGNEKAKVTQETLKGDGTGGGASPAAVSAANYMKSGGDKRRSYLPYRQDLVGFFANVNGFSKNLRSF